jgi:hypothetical protein
LFEANTGIKSQINSINFGLTGGVYISQTVGFGEVILSVRVSSLTQALKPYSGGE